METLGGDIPQAFIAAVFGNPGNMIAPQVIPVKQSSNRGSVVEHANVVEDLIGEASGSEAPIDQFTVNRESDAWVLAQTLSIAQALQLGIRKQVAADQLEHPAERQVTPIPASIRQGKQVAKQFVRHPIHATQVVAKRSATIVLCVLVLGRLELIKLLPKTDLRHHTKTQPVSGVSEVFRDRFSGVHAQIQSFNAPGSSGPSG